MENFAFIRAIYWLYVRLLVIAIRQLLVTNNEDSYRGRYLILETTRYISTWIMCHNFYFYCNITCSTMAEVTVSE